MSVVLLGSTSGSITLQEPAIAGTTVLDLPNTSGTLVIAGGAQTVQFGAGSAAAPSVTFSGDTNTGIFSPGADTIAFSEGGVEAMRLDSSGNVGIGTTAPSSSAGKLVVSGAANVYGDERKILNLIDTTALATGVGAGISFWGTSESGGGTSQFGSIKGIKENATSANYAGALAFVTSNSSNVQTERMRITSGGNVSIGKATNGGTKLEVVGAIKAENSANDSGLYFSNDGSLSTINSSYGSTGAYTPIRFLTSDAERMRLSTGGTLFIGGTSSPIGTQRLVLTADGNAGTEPMLFNELRASSATENYVRFYRNGNQVGAITNTLSATAYVTSSDYRLKDNVAPMTGALAKVTQLKPVTYKWKIDGSDGQGFIAHELQAVVPDCVSGKKDGLDKQGNPEYQGIDTSFLVATLTAAIQEQQQIINDLKARIETLENT